MRAGAVALAAVVHAESESESEREGERERGREREREREREKSTGTIVLNQNRVLGVANTATRNDNFFLVELSGGDTCTALIAFVIRPAIREINKH